MIIVSQDKLLITESLALSIESIENKKEKKIMVQENCGKLYLLGIYETEERAIEVLQEIIERYTNWNNLVYGQPTGFCSPKYEMPEK